MALSPPQAKGPDALDPLAPTVWVSVGWLGLSYPDLEVAKKRYASNAKLVKLNAGRLPSRALDDKASFVIKALFRELEAYRKAQLVEAREGRTALPVLNIRLDGEVPFSALARIIFTGARAGYENFALALSEGAVQLSGPRVVRPASDTPTAHKGDLLLRRGEGGWMGFVQRRRPGGSALIEGPGQAQYLPVKVVGEAGECPTVKVYGTEITLGGLEEVEAALCRNNGEAYSVTLVPEMETRLSEIGRILAAAVPPDVCRGPFVLALPSGEEAATCEGAVSAAELGAKLSKPPVRVPGTGDTTKEPAPPSIMVLFGTVSGFEAEGGEMNSKAASRVARHVMGWRECYVGAAPQPKVTLALSLGGDAEAPVEVVEGAVPAKILECVQGRARAQRLPADTAEGATRVRFTLIVDKPPSK